MLRIAAIVLVIGGSLAAGPAVAQFGNIFGNPGPPRPPEDVPGSGAFPSQPPPVGYPPQQQQAAPQPRPQAPPPPPAARSGIQAQPLAPPPGATAAPPQQRAVITPQG